MSPQPITESEALDLLAEAFSEPAGTLKLDTPRDSLSGWDSMGALLFMAALDEKFGVELTAEESLQMRKIGDAVEFMRRHGLVR